MSISVFASIRELSAGGKYSEALEKIERAEAEGLLSAELLVWKSRILQLAEDDGSLDDVEKTLLRAIELDETCVAAVVELGWFRLNVQNDAKRAFESFQAALKLQVSVNTETLTGLLKCMQELEPNGSLEEAKLRAVRALVDETKLAEALRD
jgi:tetratricopeptide (TPR) repeat protein